jgi:hypothetical protein
MEPNGYLVEIEGIVPPHECSFCGGYASYIGTVGRKNYFFCWECNRKKVTCQTTLLLYVIEGGQNG